MDVLEKRISDQETLIINIQHQLDNANWQAMQSKAQLSLEKKILKVLTEEFNKPTEVMK